MDATRGPLLVEDARGVSVIGERTGGLSSARTSATMVFFMNWFYDILASLGLWQKNAKILFLVRPVVSPAALLRQPLHDRASP